MLNRQSVEGKSFEVWSFPPNYPPRTLNFVITPDGERNLSVTMDAGLIGDRDPEGVNYGAIGAREGPGVDSDILFPAPTAIDRLACKGDRSDAGLGKAGALGDVGLRYTAASPAHSPAHAEASIFGGNGFAGFDLSTLPGESGLFGNYQRQGLFARQAVDDASLASAQASAAQLAEAIAGFAVEDGGLFTAARDQLAQRHDYHFAASHGPAF